MLSVQYRTIDNIDYVHDRTSEKWTNWERAFCPLYRGCPFLEVVTDLTHIYIRYICMIQYIAKQWLEHHKFYKDRMKEMWLTLGSTVRCMISV